MDAKEKYEHWLDIAQYDLETANSMLSGGRWLYVVFMCQQAVEKLSISKLSSQIEKPEATKILSETKEVFAWLLTLKP